MIFGSLRHLAKDGDTFTCGDSVTRVLYTGIPITSIDGEEACSVSACRAALANFPCPRCLVHKDDLHKITKSFTLRTTETMKQVYDNALSATTNTAREKILQGAGLHLTEVCAP